jgi:glycosyltransferase involved in cell wall biosynthesis
MAKKITVSVTSDLTTDQRVIRICTTLQQMGFTVHVIARGFSNSLPLDTYNFSAQRIKCYFKKGVMQYAEFNFKLFLKLAFVKTDYFLANDLDVLIPNYMLSRLRQKKIFYDTHEYYTGVPELKNNHTKRKIWKFFEDWIFPKLPVVYTVNNSVKNKYAEEYGNKIEVVRNVPTTIDIEPMPIPTHWQNKTILLMQGAGINEGRGGMELLLAMQYLPENYYLVYIGSGTIWNAIQQKTIELNLQTRVEMIPKLAPSMLKKYTALAHVGFSLDGFDDINYLFNLPNKIFDYMHAGVPCIATAIPEVKAIYNEYACGVCIDSLNEKIIAQAIITLTQNKEQYEILKANALKAAKVFCWENESNQLKQIYKPFL